MGVSLCVVEVWVWICDAKLTIFQDIFPLSCEIVVQGKIPFVNLYQACMIFPYFYGSNVNLKPLRK